MASGNCCRDVTRTIMVLTVAAALFFQWNILSLTAGEVQKCGGLGLDWSSVVPAAVKDHSFAANPERNGALRHDGPTGGGGGVVGRQHASGPSTTSPNENNNVVLTSFFTFNRDPQRRGSELERSIGYMANLYTSVLYFGLNLVVFHDGLSDDFVRQYSRGQPPFRGGVTFERVENPDKSLSTNDFRFSAYRSYLDCHVGEFRWVLLVDASDVFFNSDPFHHFSSHANTNVTFFASHDVGTLRENRWVRTRVKKCYEHVVEDWTLDHWERQIHNAGVFGGRGDVVKCVVDCVSDQLARSPVRGRGNCNMPAVNYCIHFGGCIKDGTKDEDPTFVNPFREQCGNRSYPVIHSKCYEEGGGKIDIRICLDVRGGQLLHRKLKEGETCIERIVKVPT